MGLDQYLCRIQPDLFKPGRNSGEKIAYWRKDWPLQEFIGTENCEELIVTEELCQNILSSLDNIYDNPSLYDPNGHFKTSTKQAFTRALKLIKSGKGVMYEADW